jgi:uncharacterized protein YkwD
MRQIARIGLAVVASVGLIYAAAMGYLTPQPTPEELAEQIVARINAYRQAGGVEPLIINDYLVQIAVWRSQDMVDGGYVSHTPPEGHPTLDDVCERLGYGRFSKPVENIVTMRLQFGRRLDDVAERAVDSWRSSPGHWGWASSPYSERTGVGVAVGDGYVVITQLFLSRGEWTTLAETYQHDREAP